MRTCSACSTEIVGGPRKKWCSDACRVRTYYAGRPERRTESAERRRPTTCRIYVEPCGFCGELRTWRYKVQKQRCCPEVECQRALSVARSKAAGYVHIRRSRAKGGDRIDPAVVHERDNWTCGLCHDPIDSSRTYPDPMSASVDHVVPLASGGTHTWGNVQSAHLFCNLSKGAKRTDMVA